MASGMRDGEKLGAVWKLLPALGASGFYPMWSLGHSTLCHAVLNLVTILIPLWVKLFFGEPHRGISSPVPSLGPLSTNSALYHSAQWGSFQA